MACRSLMLGKFIGGLLIFAKPPFDGTGKMLLVLHRGTDGKWRLRREMWNEGIADRAHGG